MADAPAFDPTKPFEPVATPGAPAFDPSKPFEHVATPSALESGAKGVMDTASFGFRPALEGLAEASGMTPGPAEAPNFTDPLRPLVGGAKMAYDWISGQN